MALPPLTPEVRAEALKKAMAARKERADILTALKAGTLSLPEVLARQDDVIAKTKVRRLLTALPGVGAVSADRLLGELGISETRRVQGLGPRQREVLLERFAA
ncbi:integration host factor, actinobacterial type [Streptomyces sp. NRRL S-350]|uniref:integration host factor, actinobacterial type n=1 Tax=Streptomyces sp. NRRL S-350 TaxID=1463902 RepID=UPI0004C22EF5|nr:integration host factor, actinobacterial type [Streptomyces sp. NRRL S-350]